MDVVSSMTARNAASELIRASAMAQFEPPLIPEYTCRSGPAKAQQTPRQGGRELHPPTKEHSND